MPNVTITHIMAARMSAKVLSEEAPFLMGINLGRQDEFGEAINGFKRGDTVKIKIPAVSQVFDGSVFAQGGAASDSVQQFVNLKIDTQKHVALQFGAKEKLLEVTEFQETILRPQMRMLSSVIEADIMAKAYVTVPNVVGTAGSVPTTMKTYGQARAVMQRFLSPPSDRNCVFSSSANLELVDASKALFHKDSEIEKGFLRGMIGEAQGADFYEHQSIPVHTNGTQNMSAMTVTSAPSEDATTLAITGGTGTNTIKKGTIFTLGSGATGVFSVHPLTGVAYNVLQQFVVTADLSLSAGAGTISVFPAFSASAPNKVVSILPAAATTIAMFGAASAALPQNMMWQKDAFTAAFPPLMKLVATDGYTARLPNGVSVRVMTFSDGTNDFERTRVDVLYGFTQVRALHACRITE